MTSFGTPDFLGIGAQKSGTTWLHENLARHPGIWLPPVKELHHLDHRPPLLVERLFSGKAHLRSARRHLGRCALAAARGGSLAELRWAARYCLAPRSDAWYGRLFPRVPGVLAGEVCPGYARLSKDRVAEVQALMPRTRIVYLLRHPMERAWSALAMHFRDHYDGIDTIPEDAIEARLRKPKGWAHGEYCRNLDAWEAHYPRERILVGFFDELIEDPRALLTRILAFLGADTGPGSIPEDVGARRNAGRGETVPPRFAGVLARALVDEVRALDARFANAYTGRWLASTESHL